MVCNGSGRDGEGIAFSQGLAGVDTTTLAVVGNGKCAAMCSGAD